MLTHPKVTKQKHKSHFSLATGTKNVGKTENYLSEIENGRGDKSDNSEDKQAYVHIFGGKWRRIFKTWDRPESISVVFDLIDK